MGNANGARKSSLGAHGQASASSPTNADGDGASSSRAIPGGDASGTGGVAGTDLRCRNCKAKVVLSADCCRESTVRCFSCQRDVRVPLAAGTHFARAEAIACWEACKRSVQAGLSDRGASTRRSWGLLQDALAAEDMLHCTSGMGNVKAARLRTLARAVLAAQSGARVAAALANWKAEGLPGPSPRLTEALAALQREEMVQDFWRRLAKALSAADYSALEDLGGDAGAEGIGDLPPEVSVLACALKDLEKAEDAERLYQDGLEARIEEAVRRRDVEAIRALAAEARILGEDPTAATTAIATLVGEGSSPAPSGCPTTPNGDGGGTVGSVPLEQMSTKELRAELLKRGANCESAVAREDLIDLLRRAPTTSADGRPSFPPQRQSRARPSSAPGRARSACDDATPASPSGTPTLRRDISGSAVPPRAPTPRGGKPPASPAAGSMSAAASAGLPPASPLRRPMPPCVSTELPAPLTRSRSKDASRGAEGDTTTTPVSYRRPASAGPCRPSPLNTEGGPVEPQVEPFPAPRSRDRSLGGGLSDVIGMIRGASRAATPRRDPSREQSPQQPMPPRPGTAPAAGSAGSTRGTQPQTPQMASTPRENSASATPPPPPPLPRGVAPSVTSAPRMTPCAAPSPRGSSIPSASAASPRKSSASAASPRRSSGAIPRRPAGTPASARLNNSTSAPLPRLPPAAKKRPPARLTALARLGLERTVSSDELKYAYKQAALKWHPDRPHNRECADEAKCRFQEVKAAFDYLQPTAR
eukprot:TRINITY_DN30394_c0_g1_i1.p1 TRINITY_DN30394_c0_g1~~TRINITY_DN30394_c0_g1_i1.p1  ORF type:complete len:761 (-),score=105.13 TRINITY_DN30394_c0_g1_i1:567-2849(-)